MNKFLTGLVLATFVFACTQLPVQGPPAALIIERIDTIPVPSSIRALQVVNDSVVWFGGSGGVFGYTLNAGKDWVFDTIRVDSIVPHFRGIAVTGRSVFLLAISSPGLLFRSQDGGQSWQVVFRDDHPQAFYDAIAFWDDSHGIVIGDPTENCLSVLLTQDGGDTWKKLDCAVLPAIAEKEAAFAASNTNIALLGDHAWVVTGGGKARVFHSPDRGVTWEVAETPINQGGQMTGIYSVAFHDEKKGIVFGGDWNDKTNNSANKALSNDGGRSWKLLADGSGPGYRSCVRFVPGSEGKAILTCGIPGISYSSDNGATWQQLSDQSFYTLSFGNSWNTVWLAGNQKVAKIVWQ